MGKSSIGKKKMISGDEDVVKDTKKRYVRPSKRLSSGQKDEELSTSNEKPKLLRVLFDKLMKELQTLSMEVVEFERRAQDRYRSLIDENIHLRKKLDRLSSEVTQINKNISKLYSKRIVSDKITTSSTSEFETMPALKSESQMNGVFDDSDDEEKTDETVRKKHCSPVPDASEVSSRPRKRRAAANKREGDYANMLKQNIKFYEPKMKPASATSAAVAADTPKPREKKAKISKKGSDDCSDTEQSNDDSKESNGVSSWKMYKHIQIKPQQTDLPKPAVARFGGGRNVHFTNEWKEYAATIYPIDPSRYWNLPQSEYDRLIPIVVLILRSTPTFLSFLWDSDLEAYAKNPDKTEKEHLIRSIYDWFRSQHRIAQLRVVLNECDSAVDLNSLWDIYVREMNRRGWPIYGKRLRKGEVSIAKQQILEDFIECDINLS